MMAQGRNISLNFIFVAAVGPVWGEAGEIDNPTDVFVFSLQSNSNEESYAAREWVVHTEGGNYPWADLVLIYLE